MNARTARTRSNGRTTAGEQATGTGRFDLREAVQSRREARAPSAAHRILRIQGAQLQSRMEDGQMIVTSMKGSLAGGDVEMTGRINTSQPHGPQNANMKFHHVAIKEVLDLLQIRQEGIVAPVSGSLDLKWRGLEADAMRGSLDGTVELKLGKGEIVESPILAKLREVSAVGDLDSLKFDGGEIRANVENGRIRLDTVTLHGPDLKLSANGILGLDDGVVDVAFAIDVSDELAKRSTYYTVSNVIGMFSQEKSLKKTADGLVEVPRFSVVGMLPKPEVRWATTGESAEIAQTAKKATLPPDPAKRKRVSMVNTFGRLIGKSSADAKKD